MNFLYAINPNSPKPILQINKHIGSDKDLGMGICGITFSREVFELSALDKSLLTFFVNCMGGKVKDGYDIFNAILNAKCKTRTVIQGFAFSSGGWCGLSADVVDAYDYSLFMCHLAHDPNDATAESPFLTRVSGTIAKIISEKSGRGGKPKMSVEQVTAMLNAETYLTAQQMKDAGLIDNIISSNGKVQKIEASNLIIQDTKNIYSYYQDVSNKFIQKAVNNKNMENIHQDVVNRLKLAEGSDEKAIIAEIARRENKFTEVSNLHIEAENKVKELNEKIIQHQSAENLIRVERDSIKAQLDAANQLVETLKTEKEAINAAKVEAENKILEAENAAKKIEAENFINKFVEVGKISDKEDVVNGFVEMYMTNPKSTALMLEALPTNMHTPKVVSPENTVQQSENKFERFRVENQKRLEEEQKRYQPTV